METKDQDATQATGNGEGAPGGTSGNAYQSSADVKHKDDLNTWANLT